MSEILLIHGTAHGAWCWDGVLAELHALGRTARAIDLPGRGTDPRPPETVTLADFSKAILAATGDRPVTLVGHSAGGYAITAAAEAAPRRFAKLIYLCAYVPRPGLSLADMRRAGPSQPLAGQFRLSPDRRSFAFAATAAGLFFHDCPAPQTAFARLTAEATAPQETALASTARAEALPRHYIRCLHDRVIPPDYQSEMSTAFGPDRTDFPTGHSPFLAAPQALARLIARLAP
ncbi:MAG: alpha/beta fold hydrolase [Paracoccaceae bacterium]